MDALAEPRHAVGVARGVDDELALRVAPLRAVAAVEVDVLVAGHAQLGGHDLGDLDDDRLVEVVAAAIIGGGASRPGERQLAAARAADAEAIPRCGGRGSLSARRVTWLGRLGAGGGSGGGRREVRTIPAHRRGCGQAVVEATGRPDEEGSGD